MTAPQAVDGRGMTDLWAEAVRQGEAEGGRACRITGAAMRQVLGVGPKASWNTVGELIGLDSRSAEELAGAYLKAHQALLWR